MISYNNLALSAGRAGVSAVVDRGGRDRVNLGRDGLPREFLALNSLVPQGCPGEP